MPSHTQSNDWNLDVLSPLVITKTFNIKIKCDIYQLDPVKQILLKVCKKKSYKSIH